MRALVAYLLAAAAVAVGLWFGIGRGNGADQAAATRPRPAPPVVLAPVVAAVFADRLLALGTAIANESVDLTANRTQLIRSIHFDDGQEVVAGTLILELAAEEERSMLAEAKATLAERLTSHQRAVDLFEQQIAPESEVQTALAQLEAARSRVQMLEVILADHIVKAPFAGQLGLRRVSVGTLLQPSLVITTLDDLSVIKVDFTIPETWLSAVRVGLPIAARTDAWPGRTFPGRVAAIDTRLDPRTRSATIRAVVPNPDRLLRPGMLMKVDVDRGESATLQVPEDAILQRGEEHFVYVVADDRVARTAVRVGRRQVGRVEIVDGVQEGQLVVVDGHVRIRDGEVVQVVGVRGAGS